MSQLSDHSICCECLRKCSAGHASTAHKRLFLGLRQQVCSLLSQLHGWFLHMCNLTAWWKTQKAPSITLLESQRCSDPTFLDFSARILSKSPFSAAWNGQSSNNRTVFDKVIVYLWKHTNTSQGLAEIADWPLLVPEASHNYGRSTTLTIAFYKRSWFWEMRSLFIFAKHTRARESICICTCHAQCRLLECMTIMSNYLTIQFVVNACASVLQVMLAPPTKDHFLGPASAGLQPFVAAPRMVPAQRAIWQHDEKTQGHQVSHYLKVSAALTQPSWDFSARILSKSPFSAAWNRQHGDIQYLIHWSLICEETS